MHRNNTESDSDESTAASFPNKYRFRCPHCWRTFSSGQALGGHQNAHRFDRVVERVNNIVGRRSQAAELRPRPRPRPPPPGQMIDESGSNELVNIEDHDDDQGDKGVVDGKYGCDDNQNEIAKAMCDDVVVPPQEIISTSAADPAVLTTRDFLGEWMPVYNAGNPQEVEKSSHTTLSNPLLQPTSNKIDDDDDLDLDLKLGF